MAGPSYLSLASKALAGANLSCPIRVPHSGAAFGCRIRVGFGGHLQKDGVLGGGGGGFPLKEQKDLLKRRHTRFNGLRTV